jgi:Fe-S cluster assembly scaffold protein SufB
MPSFVINSDLALQTVLGELRELYRQHRYVKITAKAGSARSLDQNAISHAWYEQLSRELREDDALGWKSYCKLHHGVPILRAEDEDFRVAYDRVIKPLAYEQKLAAMKFWPVTSLMTKEQLSKYAEAMQVDFLRRGVRLEFPEEASTTTPNINCGSSA